jgi:hypothetical protein
VPIISPVEERICQQLCLVQILGKQWFSFKFLELNFLDFQTDIWTGKLRHYGKKYPLSKSIANDIQSPRNEKTFLKVPCHEIFYICCFCNANFPGTWLPVHIFTSPSKIGLQILLSAVNCGLTAGWCVNFTLYFINSGKFLQNRKNLGKKFESNLQRFEVGYPSPDWVD